MVQFEVRHLRRACLDCSADLTAAHPNTKRCGPCNREVRNARRRNPSQACMDCGVVLADAHGHTKRCSQCARNVRNARRRLHTRTNCNDCGDDIEPDTAHTKYCAACASARDRACAKRYQATLQGSLSRARSRFRRMARIKHLRRTDPVWHRRERARANMWYRKRRENPDLRAADNFRALAGRQNRTGEVKQALFARDGHLCGICHKPLSGPTHVDHIIPASQGGFEGIENLQLAHASCNARKRNRVTSYDIQRVAAHIAAP